MTEGRTYTPTPLEVALIHWVRAALGATPPTVRLANQGNPRPALPYVEVELVADRQAQTPTVVVTDRPAPGGGYIVETSESRTGTVQVSYRGNEALELGRRVARSLWDEDVSALNTLAGLSIQEELNDLMNVPETMSTHTEPRWVQDFMIMYCETTESDTGVGVVERVIGTGDLYVDTPGDGVPVEIDVTAP